MKLTKRKAREKNKKNTLNKARTAKKRAESQEFKSKLKLAEKTLMQEKKGAPLAFEIKHSHVFVNAFNIAYSSDAFTPSLMGAMLGGLHSSRINSILNELKFQNKKEIGERRTVTDLGKKYFSKHSTIGLAWKFKAIEFISKKYNLAIDKDLSSVAYRMHVIYTWKGLV
ncbi:MAG: hypothetical protein RPR97_04195 [Colwellia sp.]|jgi:hypothetical protein